MTGTDATLDRLRLSPSGQDDNAEAAVHSLSYLITGSLMVLIFASVIVPMMLNAIGLTDTFYSVVQRFLTIFTAIFLTFVFISWVYRVTRNAEILGFHLSLSPAWACFWILIPIVNIVSGYFVLRQLHRVTHPSGDGLPASAAPVKWLWVFVVAAFAVGRVNADYQERLAAIAGAGAPPVDTPGFLLAGLSALLAIVAASLAASFVSTVSRLQKAQLAAALTGAGMPDPREQPAFATVGPQAQSGRPSGAASWRETMEVMARFVPVAIVLYILAIALLRLGLSPFLEVDEAQFVGAVDLRLVYANSHPPLYNWLVRAALELTGWDWATSVALVKYALLAAYHLLVWKIARRLVDDRTALVAVAASAFLPQVVWMSAHTLAHSVMVMTGVVATTHAMLRALQEPTPLSFGWLGVAAALGALAKYNFFLFALPFLIVVFASEPMRARLLRRDALIAPAVFLLLVAPTLVAAVLEFAASTERLDKLYRADADLAWFDAPYIGIDGFVSLIGATFAWVGPAVLIWAAARYYDQRSGGTAATENIFADALGRTMVLALGLFAIIVLVADMHRVHERYLTPMLAIAPIYLAVAWPLSRSAWTVVPLAGGLFATVLLGMWLMVGYGQHRYVYPYDTLAAQLRRAGPEPLPILADRHVERANLILALGWPGSAEPSFAPIENEVVLFWRGRGDAPLWLAPDGFAPASGIVTLRGPLTNGQGEPLTFSYQLFERVVSQSQ